MYVKTYQICCPIYAKVNRSVPFSITTDRFRDVTRHTTTKNVWPATRSPQHKRLRLVFGASRPVCQFIRSENAANRNHRANYSSVCAHGSRMPGKHNKLRDLPHASGRNPLNPCALHRPQHPHRPPQLTLSRPISFPSLQTAERPKRRKPSRPTSPGGLLDLPATLQTHLAQFSQAFSHLIVSTGHSAIVITLCATAPGRCVAAPSRPSGPCTPKTIRSASLRLVTSSIPSARFPRSTTK
jgi:hypothetical protein